MPRRAARDQECQVASNLTFDGSARGVVVEPAREERVARRCDARRAGVKGEGKWCV